LPERRAIFAIPGDIEQATGGYAYDRRMLAELLALDWRMLHLELSGQFPAPDAATLAATYRQLAELPHGLPIVVDGLALGALPKIGAHLAPAQPLVALVHLPLALESGLSEARAAELRASERQALAAARHVITNSRSSAATLVADYGIAAAAISIAEPGTDPAPAARGSGSDVPRLLSVGSLVPRKGHDLLIAALAGLQDLPWQLTIAGDATRDPATTQSLHAAANAAGLGNRISFSGAVSEADMARLYDSADLFVLASRYETYGMVYSEALARSLPVIGTRIGAIPEVVPTGAGLLVPPDDIGALAAALHRLLVDKGERNRLARGAAAAASALPRWQDSARVFANVLEGVLA
jgi:glycosyltransferase involved in cell wall biosynthesis